MDDCDAEYEDGVIMMWITVIMMWITVRMRSRRVMERV